MEAVLKAALDAIAHGERAALVFPVATSGSVPIGHDARMVVFERAESIGTVGGGALEARAVAAARLAIAEQRAQMFDISAVSEAAQGRAPICGGTATMMIEPLSVNHRACLAEMVRLLRAREKGVEVVRIDDDKSLRLVLGCSGTSVGTLGNAAWDEAARAQLKEGLGGDSYGEITLETAIGTASVYASILQRHPVLYVVGAGHVGQAVAQVAPSAGFRVVVIDDRPEYANRARFPLAEEIFVRPFSDVLKGMPIDDLTSIAVMTRRHQWDRDAVAQALRTPAGYIGMMGSQRKVAATFDALKAGGFRGFELERVHAPIGLDLGGDTPGEIAISVVAELVQTRYLGKRQHNVSCDGTQPVPWDVLLRGCR